MCCDEYLLGVAWGGGPQGAESFYCVAPALSERMKFSDYRQHTKKEDGTRKNKNKTNTVPRWKQHTIL